MLIFWRLRVLLRKNTPGRGWDFVRAWTCLLCNFGGISYFICGVATREVIAVGAGGAEGQWGWQSTPPWINYPVINCLTGAATVNRQTTNTTRPPWRIVLQLIANGKLFQYHNKFLLITSIDTIIIHIKEITTKQYKNVRPIYKNKA